MFRLYSGKLLQNTEKVIIAVIPGVRGWGVVRFDMCSGSSGKECFWCPSWNSLFLDGQEGIAGKAWINTFNDPRGSEAGGEREVRRVFSKYRYFGATGISCV